MAVKTKATKLTTKPKPAVKATAKAKPAPKKGAEVKAEAGIGAAPKEAEAKPAKVAKPASPIVKRMGNPPLEKRRPLKKHAQRGGQFNFMKAPGAEYEFEVGDTVEVFCDHEKNRDRIRGWVKGIIVQVDHKLAAVQFRSNVYLTDGWMVPDRILWFPVNSEHIRPMAGAKKSSAKKEIVIPDY